MAYQYDGRVIYDPEADLDHGWVHVEYISNMSPDRPPILNRENFSASEAGTPINDPSIAAQIPAPAPAPASMCMGHLNLLLPPPPSLSSADSSVPAPDGPEHRDPGNRFLPVAPATGLGEEQHRRRASYDELEDQINHAPSRWAAPAPAPEHAFRASLEALHHTWLRQDAHLLAHPRPTDTARATRAKSSGSASLLLLSSGAYSRATSSGRRSSSLVAGSGGWVGNSLGAAPAWPLEIPEDAIEEDDDEDGEQEEGAEMDPVAALEEE